MPDTNQLRIGVHGATGRMGKRVCDLVHQDSSLQLCAAIASPNSRSLNQDIGLVAGFETSGLKVTSGPVADIDAAIDFSDAEASLHFAAWSAKNNVPLVVASTGFSPEQRSAMEAHAAKIPLLIAANCSLVVNVLMKLTEEAGRILAGRDFDVEIVERHHRFKADAPSGTALAFARILQKEMSLPIQKHGREGITGVRPADEIGLHAVRAGDNVGEHAVIFSTIGETMELVHKGHSRDSYAKGAIAAAKFLVGKPAGLYSMGDVLGI